MTTGTKIAAYSLSALRLATTSASFFGLRNNDLCCSKNGITFSSLCGIAQYSNLVIRPEIVATSNSKPAAWRWYNGSNVSIGWLPVEKVCRYRSANNVRPRRSPEFYVYRDTVLGSPRHQDQRRTGILAKRIFWREEGIIFSNIDLRIFTYLNSHSVFLVVA